MSNLMRPQKYFPCLLCCPPPQFVLYFVFETVPLTHLLSWKLAILARLSGNPVPGIPLPLSPPLQAWSYRYTRLCLAFCMCTGDLNSDTFDFTVLPTEQSSQPLISHLSSLILLVLRVFFPLLLPSWALLAFSVCN